MAEEFLGRRVWLFAQSLGLATEWHCTIDRSPNAERSRLLASLILAEHHLCSVDLSHCIFTADIAHVECV